MIFYFSATGNSLYVARQLTEKDEQLISIPEAIDAATFKFAVAGSERVGVISPTYNWTMPSVVSEFLDKLKLNYETKPYTFYVGTFGTTTGASAAMARTQNVTDSISTNKDINVRKNQLRHSEL